MREDVLCELPSVTPGTTDEEWDPAYVGERGLAIRSITAGVFATAVPVVDEARKSLDCTDDAVVDLTGLRGISPMDSAVGVPSLFVRGAVIKRSNGNFE